MTTQNSGPRQETAAATPKMNMSTITGPADIFHPDLTPRRTDLEPRHREELHRSAISDKVIDGRGYRTVMRTQTDSRHQRLLKNNGLSKAIWNDPQRYPGLFMPQYSVTGERRSGMYKPDKPRTDDKGRPRKYEAPAGTPSVLDVHPYNLGKLSDPVVDLWITEGIKKGDALTTAGQCAISLAGVFNWRNPDGPLGDWESVQLRGRTVYVCFDSDALTKRGVRSAMRRLGQFVASKGAKVLYVLPPSALGDDVKVGVDDYLASGGTVQTLQSLATKRPPGEPLNASATDAVMAQRVADEVLVGEFRWVGPLGWLHYNSGRWSQVGEEVIIDTVRRYVLELRAEALQDNVEAETQQRLIKLQSASRITALTKLARGVEGIRADLHEFDGNPWLLNCTNGVVDLRTGELLPHGPEYLMRHCAGGAYVPDATHPDWDKALEALPDPTVRDYTRRFLGTGATGFATTDVALVMAGGGSNGKSTIVNGCGRALGSYACVLPPAVLGGGQEHFSDLLVLLGARLAYLEETGPNQRLDTNKVKRLVGTPVLKAKPHYSQAVEFSATHSLVLTTNNLPTVTETDHGTWRRLQLVPFEKTFDAAAKDETLRDRVCNDELVQQAVLAWVVSGAIDYARAAQTLPPVPGGIQAATAEWREEGDLLFAFLPRYLESDPDSFVELRRMLDDFNDELPTAQHPWGPASFRGRVKDHPALKAFGGRWGRHPETRRSGFWGVKVKRDR